MQSPLSKLPDLGKAFQQLKAIQGSDQRKESAIQELKQAYLRAGFSEFMAENLAKEKYLLIHKNR